MTCASKHARPRPGAPAAQPAGRPAGRPRRPRTSASPGRSGWPPRGQGYLVAASSAARVRLSPTLATRPASSVVEPLGLDAGQQPQRLRVALEAAAVRGDLGERLLAVVAERRVAQVVRQAGGLHQVGVAAERRAQLPADLGAFERVGEPGAGRGVDLRHRGARVDHLGLAGQPAQRGGVQHPCAVALEGGAAGPFVRLGHPALGGGFVVRRVVGGGLCRCRRRVPVHTATVTRPRGRRRRRGADRRSGGARPAGPGLSAGPVRGGRGRGRRAGAPARAGC